MARQTELQKAYEAALLKGLTSDIAAERVASIKAVSDRENPALGELTTKLKQCEDRLDEAKSSLKETQTAFEAATAELATLRPQVERGLTAEAELSTLKATNDEWKAEQVKLLTADAQRKLWDAQRAERAAQETMKSAQRQFSSSGLELLMTSMSELITSHNIPAPDIWNLPKNFNPLFLTLWPGWTRIKASLFVSFMKSYPAPSEGFKQALERCLTERLPIHNNGPVIPLALLGIEPDPTVTAPRNEPKVIEHLAVKIEVLTMMARHWDVFDEVQRRVEVEEVRRHAQALQNNAAYLQAQENFLAERGYGKETSVGTEEPSSVTGYEGPHDKDCVCGRPGCNPLPAHLRPYEIEEPL
jgi:hypothetical protein